MGESVTWSQPEILIAADKIQERVRELAMQINRDFEGREMTAICVLKGSFIFYTDLLRHLDMPLSCEFLGLSSYGNRKVSSGEVRVTLDLTEPLEGRHVLVVEDIVDSGLTLNFLVNMLKARRPATLKVCSLLAKPRSFKVPVELDYVGFTLGDEFAVGYGLDYAGKYRGLPYIGYLQSEH